MEGEMYIPTDLVNKKEIKVEKPVRESILKKMAIEVRKYKEFIDYATDKVEAAAQNETNREIYGVLNKRQEMVRNGETDLSHSVRVDTKRGLIMMDAYLDNREDQELGVKGTPHMWILNVGVDEATRYNGMDQEQLKDFMTSQIKESEISVLLHGWGGNSMVFLEAAKNFLRMRGEGEKPQVALAASIFGAEKTLIDKDNYSFTTAAKQVGNLVEKISKSEMFGDIKERITEVLGHSMGGYVATEMSTMYDQELPNAKFIAHTAVMEGLHNKKELRDMEELQEEHVKMLSQFWGKTLKFFTGLPNPGIGNFELPVHDIAMSVGDKLLLTRYMFDRLMLDKKDESLRSVRAATSWELLNDANCLQLDTKLLADAESFRKRAMLHKIHDVVVNNRLVMVTAEKDGILHPKHNIAFAEANNIQNKVLMNEGHYVSDNGWKEIRNWLNGLTKNPLSQVG